MGKEYLGEFEELVLTMVGILQDDAYGNAIVNEIKERVGRDSNLSAVHVTLYRLEDKGLVKSSMGVGDEPKTGISIDSSVARWWDRWDRFRPGSKRLCSVP